MLSKIQFLIFTVATLLILNLSTKETSASSQTFFDENLIQLISNISSKISEAEIQRIHAEDLFQKFAKPSTRLKAWKAVYGPVLEAKTSIETLAQLFPEVEDSSTFKALLARHRIVARASTDTGAGAAVRNLGLLSWSELQVDLIVEEEERKEEPHQITTDANAERPKEIESSAIIGRRTRELWDSYSNVDRQSILTWGDPGADLESTSSDGAQFWSEDKDSQKTRDWQEAQANDYADILESLANAEKNEIGDNAFSTEYYQAAKHLREHKDMNYFVRFYKYVDIDSSCEFGLNESGIDYARHLFSFVSKPSVLVFNLVDHAPIAKRILNGFERGDRLHLVCEKIEVDPSYDPAHPQIPPQSTTSFHPTYNQSNHTLTVKWAYSLPEPNSVGRTILKTIHQDVENLLESIFL